MVCVACRPVKAIQFKAKKTLCEWFRKHIEFLIFRFYILMLSRSRLVTILVKSTTSGIIISLT